MDINRFEELAEKDEKIVKGQPHIIAELIEYKHNAVVSKSIFRKATGSIDVLAFANSEELTQEESPFDTYAQIIDGSAIIKIDEKVSILQTGEGIIIPALKSSHIKFTERCKLILTTIKSAYN